MFYLGMGGSLIKKKSTIHFQLSISRSSRKKMYLFNCLSLRILVVVLWFELLGLFVACFGWRFLKVSDNRVVMVGLKCG